MTRHLCIILAQYNLLSPAQALAKAKLGFIGHNLYCLFIVRRFLFIVVNIFLETPNAA